MSLCFCLFFTTGIVLCVSGVVISFRGTNYFFIGELFLVSYCPGIVISFSRSCSLSVRGGALLFFIVRLSVGGVLEGRRALVTIKTKL